MVNNISETEDEIKNIKKQIEEITKEIKSIMKIIDNFGMMNYCPMCKATKPPEYEICYPHTVSCIKRKLIELEDRVSDC